MVQCGKIQSFFVTLQNGQEKVKVKTTSLVHNFIILTNGWNHDRRSMSNGSMSYCVHKVIPILLFHDNVGHFPVDLIYMS